MMTSPIMQNHTERCIVKYILGKAWYLPYKCWSALPFCTNAALIVCSLTSMSVNCQSADQVRAPLMNLQIKTHAQYVNMCLYFVWKKLHDMLWIIYCAPCASFSMKRLLSSVIPNILIQESMIFPTVVSFGVLRWTIRSDAAMNDTTRLDLFFHNYPLEI